MRIETVLVEWYTRSRSRVRLIMPLQSDKPFGGMAQQGVVDAVHKCTLLLCNTCIAAFEKTPAGDERINMGIYRCLTCPGGLLLTVSILT
jgi:hypothetical protein